MWEFSIDEIVADASERGEQLDQEWHEQHIPVKVNGKTYWITQQVPAELQNVIKHLPGKQNDGDVKRPHQIKTRLSDEELESFNLLVQASQLPQGDYIRGMVLHGTVEVTQTSLVDQEALDTLTWLAAHLGKVAGLIRNSVIVNKEFKTLSPADKDALEKEIRRLRKIQSLLQQLAEEIHGHLQA